MFKKRLFAAACIAVSMACFASLASAAPAPKLRIVAGTLGVNGFNGDHRKATRLQLNFPIDVAPTRGGSFYIADEVNNRIRLVNASGVMTTVAGNGQICAGHVPNSLSDPCGDLRKAKRASFHQPTSVAPLKGGGFLVADRMDNVVRKVNRRGIISTVAGTGDNCTPVAGGACGDGGPATAALLDGPDRAIPTPDGGFLITEDQGNRVRKVDAAGNISTVAGQANGDSCTVSTNACGDGGPATAASLNAPNGVAVFRNGSFVITDSLDNRVRLVDTDGDIFTIAGDGDAGSFTPDNGDAFSAELNNPSDVAIAPDQSIIVADTYSQIIRRLVSDGLGGFFISTIAGVADSTDNPCGRVAPATSCDLKSPYGVGVDTKGHVFIADHENAVVRMLSTKFRRRR